MELQNFVKKQKYLNSRPKMPYLGIFKQEFKKNYCQIWNQHPQICLFAKFHEKTKMPKFGTKNAWFVCFWAGIWKQYCHIWNQPPQICLTAKFSRKTRMPKFGTKNVLTGYSWARILKSYCHIWNQHLQICQKWVLNSYSEFWYWVRFF